MKNKIAPPFATVEVDILFNNGIDQIASLLDAAEAMHLVERRGAWYDFNDLKLVSQFSLTVLDLCSS